MKERVKVMQDMYENRSTNKKAAGCTVIISGEIKDVMDKIIAKHPEYQRAMRRHLQALLSAGSAYLRRNNPIWGQQCFWLPAPSHLGAAAWRVPGMSGTALLRKNTGSSRKDPRSGKDDRLSDRPPQ